MTVILILLLLLTLALGITAGRLLALRRDYAETLARVVTLRTQIADLVDTNNEATHLIYQHQAVIDAQRTVMAELARENDAMKQALKSRVLRVYQSLPESPVPNLESICWN